MCSRTIVCEECGGDREFDIVVGHDPDGAVWRSVRCAGCNGKGEYEIELEPITQSDLEEIHAHP